MGLNPDLLRSSFAMVIERDPKLTGRFYGIFFERYPQVKPLFGRHSAEQQQEMLGQTLGAALDHLEDAPWLKQALHALGVRHEGYGVTEEMYPWVGECLIAAMAEVGGDDWTQEMTEAWVAVYGAITEMTIAGHLAARAGEA